MTLTDRQNKILRMIVDGEPYKAIADFLKISIKTVDWHVEEVKTKTGQRSLAALIKWALLNGVSPLCSVGYAATTRAKTVFDQKRVNTEILFLLTARTAAQRNVRGANGIDWVWARRVDLQSK